MSNHRAIRVVACAALALTAACTGSVIDPGSATNDGAHAKDVGTGGSAWAAGQSRSVLGVDGKPLVGTATGTAIGDELLVRFVDGTDAADAQAAIAHAGGVVTFHARATGYDVVRFGGTASAEQGATILRDDPRVLEAIFNHVMVGSDAGGSGIGTSPGVTVELGNQQWNLWAMTMDPFAPRKTAAGVTIAVLDTGVAYENYSDSHGTYLQAPDLSGVSFAPGYDFINNDEHPNDDQRHGTHVTGIMAASGGIASIAPGATILPVKVLDSGNSGTELALAEGLMFAADHGANVINMSLSFPPTYFPSRLLQSAIDYASQRGCVMIAAAGNHGEGIVSYPAKFRDVIAVGASALPSWFHTSGDDGDDWWDETLGLLERAAYSDHDYKLDVMAPGGRIDTDANGDGHPEAVLAQTFAVGDPTSFGYYFYAGTSQAAAQVSAIAAVMIKQNANLGPFDVRALLVENAKKMGFSVLSSDSGRGAVRFHKTMAAAKKASATAYRERFIANVVLTLHDVGAATIAKAKVEILDDQGQPETFVKVYGQFTGAAFASVSAMTDAHGMVTFTSAPLSGNLVVAFSVDAVMEGTGAKAAFDRPRGFVRIDSESLELLSLFGSAIGTSPSGIGTSPGTGASGGEGGTSGSGIGTSPGIILPLDPGQTPISIAYDPALFAGTNYRPTLLLPNFSWGLATAPMAVAVDEAWFLATFPGAAARRVVSYGKGIGSSNFYFDPVTSFPSPISLVMDTAPVRLSLVVLTFTSGIGTSPSSIGTSPSGSGIGTSPGVIESLIVDRTYSGLDAFLAAQYQGVFDAWYAHASGVGTSPGYTGGGYTFPESTFNSLSGTANAYIPFAELELAAPASAYGVTLGAASMPMAPVSPAVDGEGFGVAHY